VFDVTADVSRPRSHTFWKVATIVVAVGAVTLLVPAARQVGQSAESPRAVRFQIAPPAQTHLGDPFPPAISPDGRRVAFAATGHDRSLWVRSLDSLSTRELPGTAAAAFPFWSPDSRFVAFAAGGRLKRVNVDTGLLHPLCDAPGLRGGAWSSDGVILFGLRGKGLFSVVDSGGIPTPVTTVDTRLNEVEHRLLGFLPDGRRFLYRIVSDHPQRSGVYVGSLDGEKPKRLFNLDSAPLADRLVYARQGYVLLNRGQSLVAQRFDPATLVPAQDAVIVADGVAEGMFSVSDDGNLVYRNGTEDVQIASFDRAGRRIGALGEVGTRYVTLDLSRDGTRLAISREDSQTGNTNLWVLDLARNVMTRITGAAIDDVDPHWSPDGTQIMFGSTRDPHRIHFVTPASGGSQLRVKSFSAPVFSLDDWSPDGRYLLHHDATTPELWVMALNASGKSQLVSRALSGVVDQARFSPDGRWVAFNNNQSGRHEIYVVPFPPTGDKWQISNGGGVQPMWRGDATELFYLTLDGMLMSVDIAGRQTLVPGVSRPLFQTPLRAVTWATEQYAVSPDGQQFYIVAPIPGLSPAALTVVLNWPALLRK
jgi:Tol biopolymer transport system component